MYAAPNPQVPVYEYTLMPTHMRQMFQPGELQNIELAGPFSFTKGCKVMKIKKADMMGDTTSFGTMLFKIDDAGQTVQIHDEAVENEMRNAIKECMRQNNAPMTFWAYGF